MLTIKGFINIKSLTDNRPSSTSLFGEISSYARTFSRDIPEYIDSRWAGVELLLLSCKNDTGKVTLSTEFGNQILQIMKWVTVWSETATAVTTRQDFLTAIMTDHFNLISTPQCGPILSDGINRLPEWVSWSKSGQVDNTIKVWLTTQSLERDYDEYDIIVVPPLPNVDTFFRPIPEIKAALAAISPSSMMETVMDARGRVPETQLRVEVTEYTNPNIPNNEFNVSWHCLVYGPGGDNSEAIRNAIVAYVLANTNDTETSWKNIFPDLFRSTQMFIIPRWDRYAIPNRTDLAGIYSPIVSLTDAVALAQLRLTDIPVLHLQQNVEVTHHKHKSIALICVGGQDNREQKYKLSDYMGDYIGESSTHQDFFRMRALTQQWTTFMEQALIIAETATDFSSLPTGFRRTTKAGTKFIAKKIDRVEYLIATKNNA